jgi:putative ABC transport system permease protein
MVSMPKTLKKDILRLVKVTRGRFLSLTAIVAIGVAFFVGVSASSPIMAGSVDYYDDQSSLKDITVYSDYGFDDEDVSAIESLDDVSLAEGTKFVDVIGTSNDLSVVTRVHAWNENAEINKFTLQEGRLPENDHEVVAEKGSDLFNGFQIGDTIKLSRPDNDLSDWLDVDSVTVVGLIDTPLYLNETKENSTLSNQYIRTYIYIPESAFTIDYYTEVNVLTKDGKSYNSFNDSYADYDASVKQEIETLADTQADHRRQTILDEANSKYNDGLQDYEDAKKEYDDQIADAEQEIADAEQTIADGESEISSAEQKLNDSQQTLNEQQISGSIQINDARKEIADGEATLKEKEEEFAQTKADYESLESQIDSGVSQLQSTLDTLNAPAFKGTDQISALQAYMSQSEYNQLLSIANNDSTVTISSLIGTISTNIDQLNSLKDSISSENLLKLGLRDTDTLHQIEVKKNGLSALERQFIDAIPAGTLDTEKLSDIQDTNLQNLINANKSILNPTDDYTVGDAKSALTSSISALEQLDSAITTMMHQIGMNLDKDQYLFSDLTDTINQNITLLTTTKDTLNGLITNPAIPDTTLISSLSNYLTTEQYNSLTNSLSDLGLTENNTVGELKTAISSKISTLQSQKQQIIDGIADGEAQLASAHQELTDAYNQTVNASVEMDEKIAEGQQEIDDGWSTLNDKKQELEDGKKDLEDAKTKLADSKQDGQQKLEDAKADLDKAKQDIDDLSTGSWTVLDRSEHYASETYKASVNQMKSIAAIFPVFFFLVAALVCLTTMTRMVDEQRGQIGILRALGYTQRQCAMKYLMYAAMATLIGEAIGSVLGLLIFPPVIYNAWKMMYVLPKMKLTVPWSLIIVANGSFLAVMLWTTYMACRSDMKEVPSQLMRPKAPKLGKSTFIEKIPLIWNHVSFTWKVTIRNLIRYKKRFFMTVFGVAGCTALLITGYGIKDSVSTIVTTQFGVIDKYDGIARTKDTETPSQIKQLKTDIEARDDVSQVTLVEFYTGTAYGDNNQEETIRTEIYPEASDIENTYLLRDYKTGKEMTLGDDGVIISEKLAKNLGLKAGDTMTIESETGVRKEVKISGICEMYIYHYVYMSETYYESVFGTAVSGNAYFIKCVNDDSTNLQKDLVTMDGVDSIEFYDVVESNFSSMVKSLDIIVVVLILSSMSLAFVVLGNLTSVNISERQREIATLKVLGFRRNEVNSYIYKENNVLTFIGALVGIPLGQWLHSYIMGQIDMDYVTFGREVAPTSMLMSVCITIGFGLLVNAVMTKRLQSIQMVESLKSVE